MPDTRSELVEHVRMTVDEIAEVVIAFEGMGQALNTPQSEPGDSMRFMAGLLNIRDTARDELEWTRRQPAKGDPILARILTAWRSQLTQLDVLLGLVLLVNTGITLGGFDSSAFRPTVERFMTAWRGWLAMDEPFSADAF
jgi:hypothetical protein